MALFLAVCMTFLPAIRRAAADQAVKTAVAKALREYALADDIADLADKLTIEDGLTGRPVVRVPTGERWELSDVQRDGDIIYAGFQLRDSSGVVVAASEQFVVSMENPNTYSGAGTVLIPDSQVPPVMHPVAAEASLVGTAAASASTYFTLDAARTASVLVDYTDLFPNNRGNISPRAARSEVSELSGLNFYTVEFQSGGERWVDPVVTPVLVGVGGAAAVAAILIIAIVGCFLGWWCMYSPMPMEHVTTERVESALC